LDDLGGLEQHVLRDGEAERLRRLEVDDEVERHGLLYGELGWYRTLKDLVYVRSSTTVHIWHIRSIRHKPASIYVLPRPVHCGQAMLCREVHYLA
jgi:hypothetical protein